MQIPAKVDYGLRALLCLAVDSPQTADAIAAGQQMPSRFVGIILSELRRAGLVTSQRGPDGGFRMARPPASVSLADVFRILDGPLAEVRGLRPEASEYEGPAAHLQEVWVALRANVRQVLENITLADVLAGRFPTELEPLTADPDAWRSRNEVLAGQPPEKARQTS
jgi:Rrf2 family protein